MSRLPIACTLNATDLAAVKDHYRAAASQYQATARIDGDHADISLTGDKPTLQELLDEMIARESACCPFLAFGVEETPTGFDVRLSVLDASGLERGILAESVNAFFPAATVVDAASGLIYLQGAFTGLRPFPGHDAEREAATQRALRETLDRSDE